MNGMRMAGRLRLALGELALIVAGVSLALAADSLWDFRQDRASEREYLAQLITDLGENRQRLEDALALERQQQAAAAKVLDALAAGSPLTAQTARQWLIDERGLYYADPRLITGTLSALVQNGDLRLIRDSGKRNAVVSYLAQITEDKEEFDRFVEESLFALRIFREVGSSPPAGWQLIGDSAVRAVMKRPVEPAVAAALEHVITAAALRQVYLERMLAATRELDELLRRS